MVGSVRQNVTSDPTTEMNLSDQILNTGHSSIVYQKRTGKAYVHKYKDMLTFHRAIPKYKNDYTEDMSNQFGQFFEVDALATYFVDAQNG